MLRLKRLRLTNCPQAFDECVLAALGPRLETLSLIECPALTDAVLNWEVIPGVTAPLRDLDIRRCRMINGWARAIVSARAAGVRYVTYE